MPTIRLDLIFSAAVQLALVASPPAASAQQRPPAATPATSPQRTETIRYDGWNVTCQDTVGGTAKRTCLASFAVADDQKRQILKWLVTRNQQGALVFIVQAPQTSAGISIDAGLQVKLGAAGPRKLNYSMCASNHCQASIPLDDTMMKELLAAKEAIVTLTSPASQQININIKDVKGTDKAIQALGR